MEIKRIGFILGIVLFLLILFIPVPSSFLSTAQHVVVQQQADLDARRLAESMQSVLAVLVLMIVWWLTEAVSLPATALLPAVLFPLLRVTGLQEKVTFQFTARNTLLNYANPVIYLFLGGFLIAGAMQKWKLDRRFTLWFLTRGKLANDSRSVLFGIMAVTAFLSMWISNTATAAMMLPLGLGILSLTGAEPGKSRYGTALMLGIAWAASIGGVGTIIGTPPNGIALGILNSTFGSDPTYHRITFLDWMKFGVPYVLMYLPVAWFILLKLHPPEVISLPGGKERLLQDRKALGSLSSGERGTIAVFLLAVSLWITNPFWDSLLPPFLAGRVSWLDEYLIGLLCGSLLFFIPVKLSKGSFLLDWRDTKFVDWGTLILFGGGIALSDAMFKTGLAAWIATSFVGLFGAPSTVVMVFAVVFLIDFLTEVTSNTAVTSMMVPVVISIALKTGENPITVAVAAAIAASMAFMLPVATPPNALVYGTGYIALKDMVRAGFILDIIGWFMTVFVVLVIAGRLWGVVGY